MERVQGTLEPGKGCSQGVGGGRGRGACVTREGRGVAKTMMDEAELIAEALMTMHLHTIWSQRPATPVPAHIAK